MRFSLRFTFTVIYLPAPFVGKITLTSVPVLRLGKVQRSAESRRPFAHNIQPVMSRRLAGFANPDTVIANADAVGAVSRRHAADGYLAGRACFIAFNTASRTICSKCTCFWASSASEERRQSRYSFACVWLCNPSSDSCRAAGRLAWLSVRRKVVSSSRN